MKALLVLAAALLVVGCGGSPEPEPTAAPSEAMQYSACMRDNGVAEFPDPDASGALTIDAVVNGTSIDADSAEFERARDACQDLQPAGFTGTKRSDSEQETALDFAQCIRDHGVEDFRDPEKGEPLVNTNLIPSAATSEGKATLNAAMQACRDHVRDQVDGR